MRATRLTVSNFRNLGAVSVPLTSGTVIVGENGVGKSNLIHALRLVLDPTMSWADRTLGREDFWDGLSDGSSDWDPFADGCVIEITVDLDEIESEPSALAALGRGVSDTNPLTARLTYRFQPRDDLDQPEEGAKRYEWGIFGGDSDERIGNDLRRFLAHVHLGALRNVEGDLSNWRRSPLRSLIEEAAEEADSEELEAVAEALDGANETLAGLRPVKDLAREIAEETERFAGRHHGLDASLGLTPVEPLRILRGLRLFLDGTTRRRLSAANLGALNVLYLALLELRLSRQLNNGEIAHAVLSIEEPEAHLHPHTQRKVFSRLLGESASRTVLVTTHSPHIVSVTPPEQLVVLRATSEGVVAAAAATADLTEEEWHDVGRYLDATRSEMVFARKVLLVEGLAEQVLIPSLAASLEIDLDSEGVSVCAIHGTHFDVYARLLTALGVPWAIITDGDPKQEDPTNLQGAARARRVLKALEREAEDPADVGLFVGDVTFEHDLYSVSEENAAACVEALSELVSAVSEDDELDADEFLKKVKRRKGRFAQRLGATERELEAPHYVIQALEYLTRE
jgi:putative ATP-dependent endonuclease of the OLD family